MVETIDLHPVIEHGRVVYTVCTRQLGRCRSVVPGLLVWAALAVVLVVWERFPPSVSE